MDDILFFCRFIHPGYSLKKGRLKIWIYSNGYTQPYVARKLGMDVDDFKHRLKVHEMFEPEYIERLVYFLKAEDAFKVIYFPSNKMRREVYEKVFNKKLIERRWKMKKWVR